MLSASELRIGNWILGEEIHLYNQNIHSNGFTKITGYGIHCLENMVGLAEKYKPIPLTPEILEKSGFDDCTCGGYKMGFPQFKFHIDRDKEGLYYHQVRLHHLHQLQNLFWCLLGSELNIEL